MSCALDVNILLSASNADAGDHPLARAFLNDRAAQPEILCFAWPTLMGYLRISTHPSIFLHPLTPREAIDNVRSLLQLPHVRALSEGDGFFDIYERVAGERRIRGNLVPDAHLACILLEHGVTTLYSRDSDFKRFDFLDVRTPY